MKRRASFPPRLESHCTDELLANLFLVPRPSSQGADVLSPSAGVSEEAADRWAARQVAQFPGLPGGKPTLPSATALHIAMSIDLSCVLQNEVEAVAQKSPKQLTELLERISGSEDIKKDYEELLEEKTTSSQVTIFSDVATWHVRGRSFSPAFCRA